jgi:hypothetical protein
LDEAVAEAWGDDDDDDDDDDDVAAGDRDANGAMSHAKTMV